MFTDQFKHAIRDYKYLLNRDYPQKATIKLVGDKYQLPGVERSILYRGISGEDSAKKREAKKSECFEGERILIDTYNILFTLANYLNGRPVFISDDNYVRDAGELRGRFSKKSFQEKTLKIVFDFLADKKENEYLFFIDKPVSNSRGLTSSINELIKSNELHGKAMIYDSPDFRIIQTACKNDLVCTSDSVIIEKVEAMIYDLSFALLSNNFDNKFVRLTDFL